MINAELRAKVQQFAQENRDAIIQDIKDLVAIKSIAGQPGEGMPFGPGPRAALDKALEWLTVSALKQ